MHLDGGGLNEFLPIEYIWLNANLDRFNQTS